MLLLHPSTPAREQPQMSPQHRPRYWVACIAQLHHPLHSGGGQLQADLLPPGHLDFASVTPGFTVPSPRFPSALFDIWLQADTPVTGAREQWAASLQRMLNASAAR